MAVSTVKLNNSVLMTVNDTTTTADEVLANNNFYTADGVKRTGSIASKTSANMTASGATVTAQAGYYASDASKSVASGSATTPSTSITANPSISVSSSGLITATTSASQSVTPTVSAGYVSSGTAGTVSVSGSNTEQLSTQAAQTLYPSTTDQTISSGKYLTGTQTIKAVTTTNLTAENIADGVVVKVGDSVDDDRIISVTGTHQGGSTPSGIKYLYKDIDGEGAWTNLSDYEYVSYDFAPIKDNKYRLWVRVNSTNGMTVTPVIYARANKVTINWGDGTSEYATGSTPYTNSHTYITEGTYCIEVSDPTNNRMAPYNYAMGQSSDNPNETLIGVELYSTASDAYSRGAFSYCDNLEKVTIVNGTINSNFFLNCLSLRIVNLPYGGTSIPQNTFSGCRNLRTFEIPSSVATVGTFAFENCASLLNITIPNSVTTISGSAFYGCRSMMEYHLLPSSPPSLSSTTAFTGIPDDCIIYVPSGTLTAYQTATNWSSFASYMQEEP